MDILGRRSRSAGGARVSHPLVWQRTASIDTTGQRTEYGYDSLGRLITTTRFLDERPIHTVSVYNALGQLVNSMDAEGNVITTTYDALYRTLNTISAEGVVVTSTYDALGRVVGTVNNLNQTTTTIYDDMGRVVTTTNAANEATTQYYNIEGQRIAQKDANGTDTVYVYDDLGRQTHLFQAFEGNWADEQEMATHMANCAPAPAEVRTANFCTQTIYDVQGRQLAVLNANGYTQTQTTYDSLGRAIATQNALITSTVTTNYNVLGQVVNTTNANGAITSYLYDGLNRVAQINHEADQETVQFTYNVRGQQTVMTDSLGVTLYTYDDWGRLTAVADPFNATVGYGYNDNGQRTHLTYPDGKVVTSTYDGDKRLATVQDWQLGVSTFEYDSIGRHITTTLANGVVSVNDYNEAGRLIGRTYTQDATLLGQYQYELDSMGNKLVVTETVLAPQIVHQLETFLEENGQLVIEAEQGETAAGETHQWQAQTNHAGFADTGYLRTLPDVGQLYEANDEHAPTVTYHLQVENPAAYRLWIRASAPSAGSDSVHVTIQNPSAHAQSTFTGWTNEWEWKSEAISETGAEYPLSGIYTLTLSMREDGLRVDRLLLITDTNYIPTGEGPPASPTQVITSTSGGETIFQVVTYGYDTLYRLEQAVYSGTLNATYDYAYDNVGNRTAYTQTVQNGQTVTTATTYQYNSANHLWQSTADGITTTYSWDNAGRLITTTVDGQPTRLYSYSQDGDLQAAVVNGLLTTFLYNGKGQRLALATGGITTTYMLDYGSRINRVLYESNPNETKHYLYGGDLCLAEFVTDEVEEETEWRYYLYDGNGYVRQTVNEHAAPTYAWTFSPEGAVLLGEQGPVTHLSCNGDAVYDWSTGLIYKNGRYFDPNTGIWLTIGVVVASGNHKRRKGRGKRKGKEPTTYVWLGLFLLMVLILTGCNTSTTPSLSSMATPTCDPDYYIFTDYPLPETDRSLTLPISVVVLWDMQSLIIDPEHYSGPRHNQSSVAQSFVEANAILSQNNANLQISLAQNIKFLSQEETFRGLTGNLNPEYYQEAYTNIENYHFDNYDYRFMHGLYGDQSAILTIFYTNYLDISGGAYSYQGAIGYDEYVQNYMTNSFNENLFREKARMSPVGLNEAGMVIKSTDGLVLAHEIGHVLGLPHTSDRGRYGDPELNLMAVTPGRKLTSLQMEVMRINAQLFGAR